MATNKNKEIIYLPLEDVESEHCALIVEKGLAQVKGIETHKVELNNRRAAITVNNTEVVGEAVKVIKDLGYGVSTVKNTFPVLGMTCASCAGSEPGLIEQFVYFLSDNVPSLFEVSGLCEDEELVIMGLSLANWALVSFASALVVAVWALFKRGSD